MGRYCHVHMTLFIYGAYLGFMCYICNIMRKLQSAVENKKGKKRVKKLSAEARSL